MSIKLWWIWALWAASAAWHYIGLALNVPWPFSPPTIQDAIRDTSAMFVFALGLTGLAMVARAPNAKRPAPGEPEAG